MNVHGDVVALDCEMVGIAGDCGEMKSAMQNTLDNALCRVSVVAGSPSSGFSVLLDMWVMVESEVLDFRTTITGIDAESYAGKKKVVFSDARRSVKELIHGRTVVGHATWNDFKVLNLAHPKSQMHDTALNKDLRPPWRRDLLPSLRLLADYWLQEQIHDGIHDSISDAIVALKLYHLTLAKRSADVVGNGMTLKDGFGFKVLGLASSENKIAADERTPLFFQMCNDKEQEKNLESDASTKVEAEYSSNSTHSSSSAPSEKSRLDHFAIGDKISAYFYGEWHPGEIRRFEEGKIEILWESEWSVSLLPATHVQAGQAQDTSNEEVFDNDDVVVTTPELELQKDIMRGRWRKC